MRARSPGEIPFRLVLAKRHARVDPNPPRPDAGLLHVEVGDRGVQVATERLLVPRLVPLLLTPGTPARVQLGHRDRLLGADLAGVTEEGPDRRGQVLQVAQDPRRRGRLLEVAPGP